ncbi:AfsR/SARP family transcriptional regulator [Nocardia colli]|uniref:AfsR/SARP family transcriptional regulator n=1 Tax=Nocardia colli TaxID=2545717 RepID=A0A5N0EI38_9NOCA|nr:BTAD domain-containing putative transcriptional regulator [Nocardia colli]KAA8887031.1 AfsR/SARP family transcriptional regulator [Nocardia colli]
MIEPRAAAEPVRRSRRGPGNAGAEVHILGPVRVVNDGRDLGVDRPLEQAALVRLALARGVPVPDGRLVADLWGEEDLSRPIARLRVLISRLRTALGEHSVMVTRSPSGYQSTVVVADLIAAEAAADRMHAAQRAGQYAAVRSAAEDALRWWRGPALVNLMSTPFACAESARLEQWRLGVTVARLDATLHLGSGAEIATELATLVREHPQHEPLARLYALTLYRTGSQADALDRLHRLRRALSDELGVDPTPETAELELRILRHDPSLQPPRPTHTIDIADSPTDTTCPTPADAFVGRHEELAAVLESLRAPAVVTLLGGPGSGKTRLALEAARKVAAAGRAVVFVELATLQRSATINQAIAVAVDAAPEGCPEAVRAALTGVVLVLDNAEHVTDEVRAIVEALTMQVPGLTSLITSQRALELPAESLIRIAALDHPAGLELFAERAMCPLMAADRSDVVAVCAAVDWLPLGIELAAGMTRTFTISQLAQRIDGRIRLRMGSRRGIGGGRHSSLRAALDWSHELLDPTEQAVLRRISVFAGGFELEAAELVVPCGSLETADVAPALAGLVDRGLATVLVDGANRRFALLEMVRDYASTRLADAGEAAVVRQRHVAWCLDLIRAAGAVDEFDSAASVAAAFAEWSNVLDALEHAANAPWAHVGLRLAIAMHKPWTVRAWHQEASRHFAALIAAAATAAERANALNSYAFHLMLLGRFDESARLLTSAAEAADGLGDHSLSLDIRYHRGIVDIECGQLGAAVATLEAGELYARRVGDHTRTASFANAGGTAQLFAGLAESGLDSFRRAIRLDKESNDEHGLARGLSNRATALAALGRPAEALAAAGKSDSCAERWEDRKILSLNELTRAAVELAAGRLEAAEKHCRAAQSYLGNEIGTADVDLADVLIRKGELVTAKAVLDNVYAQVVPGGIAWLAARPISAALAAAHGDWETAAVLVGQTTGQYARSGFGWQRYVDRLRDIQAQLAARRPLTQAVTMSVRPTPTFRQRY